MQNKNKDIKAIVFDLGGVYFENALASFSLLSKMEGFKTNRFLDIFKKKYLKKIEVSKISESDFWYRFKQDVGFKMTVAEAKNIFISYHKPMKGMKDLVRKLRKKYKVGLLTNNSDVWYNLADRHFKITPEFDAVVISSCVKCRKPNKKIYKIMSDKLSVLLSECIFFDDFYENIVGARKVGMQAVKFNSTEEAEKYLVDTGILRKTREPEKGKTRSKLKVNQSMPTVVTFKVNNKEYKSIPGISVLKALGENGIYVPTLCYAPIFPARANCRVCLVEIKGQRNLATACSTQISDGMEIFVDSEKVAKSRRTNLKLLYQDHIGKCPTCIRLKNCELLRLVSKYQAGSPDFKTSMRTFKKDTSGVVVFDREKCIKCGRCIEACKKYGSDVLEIKGRGFDAVIGTKNGKQLKNSGCISCKQCAQVCPVGAIYEKE